MDTVKLTELGPEKLRRAMRHRFDAVIECTAVPDIFELALELIRPRGTLVAESTLSKTGELNLNKVVVNEIQVQGSRCGPFDKVLQCLTEVTTAGWLNMADLIVQEFSLSAALTAFHRAAQPCVPKVLLRP